MSPVVVNVHERVMGETVRAVTVNGTNMLSYSGYLLKRI